MLGDYSDFVDEDLEYQGKNGLARDGSGHGSAMVEILHRTAPWAGIYVARVFATDAGDVNTAENIAKAIEHARDVWKVDIISMSFGFADRHPNPTLERAINGTKTLMFAASTNYGAIEDIPIRYPARAKHRVICIHAADGNGHPSETNAPSELGECNFSILGKHVEITTESQDQDPITVRSGKTSKMACKSGSSIATPIAAGVAALVLQFASQPGLHAPKVPKEELDDLRSIHGMSLVFRRMAKNGNNRGFDFIAPWKVLLGDPKLSEKERMAQEDIQRMGAVCKTIADALNHRPD